MPHRVVEERLRDILNATQRIQAYTGTLTYEQFCGDQETVEACQLNFIIIGEAVRNVPEGIAAAHPEIPWKEQGANGRSAERGQRVGTEIQ